MLDCFEGKFRIITSLLFTPFYTFPGQWRERHEKRCFQSNRVTAQTGCEATGLWRSLL